MYKILKKQVLSDAVKLLAVEAPQIAKKTLPGQFIVLRIDEKGERIPLTIADFDRAAGTITIIFQELGKSTLHLGTLGEGDSLATFVGPLGRPTDIKKYGTVVCVGGGVGIAPVFPIARALKEAGNEVISIIGARTKELLFWEAGMRRVSDQLVVCTDDGSCGRKALVTEPLKELLQARGKDISRVWAIGPALMMKFAAQTTRPFQVHTIVSLNTIMIDGTGMCGGCRVLLDEGARFVCVDGPEFDAHRIDWDNLVSRLGFYRAEEQLAVENWKHKCALDGAVKES